MIIPKIVLIHFFLPQNQNFILTTKATFNQRLKTTKDFNNKIERKKSKPMNCPLAYENP